MLFEGDIRRTENDQIIQQQVKIDGIKRVLGIAPEKYRLGLRIFLETEEAKATNFRMRVGVREKWFLPRIFATFGLLMSGGYRNSSGLKAVLRDLVG